jgi:hypothetical protein
MWKEVEPGDGNLVAMLPRPVAYVACRALAALLITL